MSLQIWLPLNGNLNNQGLSSAAITALSTPTYSNNGKIGQCAYGAYKINYKHTNNEVSVAFWICLTGSSQWADIFSFGTGLNRIENISASGSTSCMQYWYNTSGSAFITGQDLFTLTVGKWTHVIMTADGQNVRFYIDGQLVKTTAQISTVSAGLFDRDYFYIGCRDGGTDRYSANLNDFRLYDHCLSQKEVQELAKGLVLHYRLAGPGQENIIEHSHNGSGWSIGSGWTAFTDGDGTKGYRFTRTGATSNNWVRVIPPTKINPNDYPEGITVSMDIKTPDISAVNHTCVGALQIYDSTGTRSGWCEPRWDLSKVKNNVWTKVSYFFTQAQLRTISTSGMTYSYTMFSFQLVQNGDISIKNFKAERGNVRTPWTPNKADAAWTTMGYSNNIEYDCSGYGNNGTKSGQLTWNVDSPRYTTSYKVGLTKAYVDTPNIAFEQMLQGTLNMWINRHSSTSDWRQYACFANAYNWTSTEQDFIIIGSTGGAPLHLDCCSNTYSYTPTLNEWHMYTITWDLQQHTSNFYIDGELVRTTTNAKIDTLYASKHNYHAFGNRLSSDVNDYSMSDARIYSTVLSAEAVAELYHSAVIIDNTGKTYAYEYFEG